MKHGFESRIVSIAAFNWPSLASCRTGRATWLPGCQVANLAVIKLSFSVDKYPEPKKTLNDLQLASVRMSREGQATLQSPTAETGEDTQVNWLNVLVKAELRADIAYFSHCVFQIQVARCCNEGRLNGCMYDWRFCCYENKWLRLSLARNCSRAMVSPIPVQVT